ncbi:MAG: NHLP family bacteriocin export ABC transporter peptidase/permease/ATPase subunit [Terrimicrobiaceae bacterium]|nr:NHLP family bacteriocin export ABC transporter peptidase/permease/ATPase subunit [Terrimicrobiaceae bacterium]
MRTPTVIQMEAVECGAAALAIVLGHFGKVVPLEEVREECGVSRDGSKALNIIKAARRMGMEAKGYKYELEHLNNATLPAILFWNFNHFVVLEGFGGNGAFAWINDPATGPRRVPMQEFSESFTGVTLILEPGPDFRRGGTRDSIWAFLLSRLRGSENAAMFSILCALFLVIPGLLVPAFTRVFVDDFLIGTEKNWIRPLLLGMGVTLVVQAGLTWLQQKCLLRFQTKLSMRGSGELVAHVLRLPMKYFAQRFAGEIGSRVALVDSVSELAGRQLTKIGLDFVLLLFFGVLLFFYDAVLGAIVVGTALMNAGILRLAARVRADKNRVATQEGGKLLGTSINGLQMMETLKAGGGEDEFFGRWSGYQARYLAEKQSLQRVTQYATSGPKLLDGLSSAAVLGVGAFRIMSGDMTVGTLIAFQSLAANFNAPLLSLIQFGNNLQLLRANIGRINDVFRAPEDPVYAAGERRPSGRAKLSGHVVMENVTFGYSPLEAPLIENFSLELQPGSRVALVGASGSGKSTVSRLVAGLYRPWSGRVLFDGMTIDEIPRELFAGSVGMVDQDLVFFSGTVRDNLTLWDTTVGDRMIHEACVDAEIAAAVLSRPGGYHSEVAEGGRNFSGGQRQRLEIARSLVNNPSILLLDEATSALDATTEAAIDRNIRRRGCTCLIVAHRLSTIRDADEIVVMERGRVVERGRFDDLMKRGGVFFHLMQQ